jgi:hypothetical protein
MTDTQPVNDLFMLKHWERLHAEMNEVVSRYVELERYALLSTGAIWTWLATTIDSDWNPALKWLPLLLNAFFALRAIGLVLRTREITAYLAAAEKHFSVPPQLALENAYKPRSLKMLTVWAFWPLLLAATLVLPYFYIERAAETDCGDRQALTSRPTRTAASVLSLQMLPIKVTKEASTSPPAAAA